MKRLALASTLFLALTSSVVHAQPAPPYGPGPAAGCPLTGCTFSGPVNINAGSIGGATLGNTAIVVGVRNDSPPTPANGGTGYAVGDLLTLNDGCSTHATLVPVTVSTSSPVGAITAYNVVTQGMCAAAPAMPVSVLSTTGSGTGATFNLFYGQLVSGNLSTGTVNPDNNGNLWIGQRTGIPFSGTESTFIGAGAAGRFTSGNFVTAVGLDACGIGGGQNISGAGSMVCLGVDTGRNMKQGVFSDILIGVGNAESIATNSVVVVGIGSANALTTADQTIVLGNGSAPSLTTGPGGVFIGNSADVTTPTLGGEVIIGSNENGGGIGARGGWRSVVIGATAGSAGLTANNYTALGFAVASTVCSSGGNVLLLGTSAATTCAAPAESNAIHIGAGGGDIINAFGTGTPSTSVTKVAGTLNVVGPLQTNGTPGVTHVCTLGSGVVLTIVNGLITATASC